AVPPPPSFPTRRSSDLFDLGPAERPITITTSIGIATGMRANPGALLRDADVALYQAKAAGKNCYAVFKPEMETSVQRRYEIELRSEEHTSELQSRFDLV